MQALTQNSLIILQIALKNVVKNNSIIYTSRATKNYKWFIEGKSKAKSLQHFKVDQVLKIDATFFGSMLTTEVYKERLLQMTIDNNGTAIMCLKRKHHLRQTWNTEPELIPYMSFFRLKF